MSVSPQATVLVSGAAGQFGRSAVEQLLASHRGRIIATTRSPEKLADLAEQGVDVRLADFTDPATLETAFAGAERLLLISTDALHTPGLRITQHRNAIAAAQQAGVRHVVYTSGPSPYPTPESSLIGDHYWTEHALAASTMEWTVLRNHLYSQTLLRSLPTAAASGQLISSMGEGARNYVTREDCVRTAVGALLKDEGRHIFDVTGPAPVTAAGLAALAAEVSGREVALVPVSTEAQAEAMSGAGLPRFIIDALVGFDTAAACGYHAINTPVVERFSGRRPTALRDFLAEHRSAFAA